MASKKIQPSPVSLLRSHADRGQGLLCLSRWFGADHTSRADRSPTRSSLQPFSKTWPYELQLSQSDNLTWHYTDPPPFSNKQKHPQPDPDYTPFSTFQLLRSPFGAITTWLSHNTGRDNLSSERLFSLSPSLSLCGCGLERWTQFQTHVSVICRSVFHQRAVQGLRNACSVLPGLSACRLRLLTTALGHTHEDEPPSFITTATTRWLPRHCPSQH